MIKNFGFENKYHSDGETGIITNDYFDFIDRAHKHRHKNKNSLTLTKSNSGYYGIHYIDKNGIPQKEYIHRINALLFCKNDDPDNKTYVDHLDCNKNNNRASNLEWVTPLENSRRSSVNGCINKDSEKRKRQAPINARKGAYKNWVSLVEYDKDGNFVSIHKKGDGTKAMGRIQSRGRYYKYYDDLVKCFGKVPKKIFVIPSRGLICKSTSYYIERKDKNGNIFEYQTIREAMEKNNLTRDILMRKLNTYCPDEDNNVWRYRKK